MTKTSSKRPAFLVGRWHQAFRRFRKKVVHWVGGQTTFGMFSVRKIDKFSDLELLAYKSYFNVYMFNNTVTVNVYVMYFLALTSLLASCRHSSRASHFILRLLTPLTYRATCSSYNVERGLLSHSSITTLLYLRITRLDSSVPERSLRSAPLEVARVTA